MAVSSNTPSNETQSGINRSNELLGVDLLAGMAMSLSSLAFREPVRRPCHLYAFSERVGGFWAFGTLCPSGAYPVGLQVLGSSLVSIQEVEGWVRVVGCRVLATSHDALIASCLVSVWNER